MRSISDCVRGFEQDSVIDPIEKLGSKVACEFVKDLFSGGQV